MVVTGAVIGEPVRKHEIVPLHNPIPATPDGPEVAPQPLPEPVPEKQPELQPEK